MGSSQQEEQDTDLEDQGKEKSASSAAAAAASSSATTARTTDNGDGKDGRTSVDRSTSEVMQTPNTSTPGAFLEIPSGSTSAAFSAVGALRRSTGSESSVDHDEEEDLESGEVDDDDVPVANAVMSDESNKYNLPRAERFHTNTNSNEHDDDLLLQKRWLQSYISGYPRGCCCCCVVFGLLFLVITMGMTIFFSVPPSGTQQQQQHHSSTNSTTTTLAPTAAALTTSIQTPGVSAEEYVLSLLPEHTKQAIRVQEANQMMNDNYDNDGQQGNTSSSSSSISSETSSSSSSSSQPQLLAYRWILDDPNLLKYTNNTIVQRYSLATLYYAAGGDQWFNNTNWLSYDHHECDWAVTDLNKLVQQHPSIKPFHSVQYYLNTSAPCDEEWINNDNHRNPYPEIKFRHLWLQKNNLQGQMPLEVYWMLTNLQSVWVSWNDLEGSTIPTQIGKLTNLEFYSVGASGFAGHIPTQVGLLSNLHTFHTATTKNMVGTIPSQIGRLTNVVALALDESQLTGTIPTQLGALHNTLELLLLYDNKLTGQIPSQLGLLSNLQIMKIERNELTGPTPTHLDLLSPQKNNGTLIGLHLQGNQLSGTLSDQLCDVGTNISCIWSPTFACELQFDCSDAFCGCDCPCNGA